MNRGKAYRAYVTVNLIGVGSEAGIVYTQLEGYEITIKSRGQEIQQCEFTCGYVDSQGKVTTKEQRI